MSIKTATTITFVSSSPSSCNVRRRSLVVVNGRVLKLLDGRGVRLCFVSMAVLDRARSLPVTFSLCPLEILAFGCRPSARRCACLCAKLRFSTFSTFAILRTYFGLFYAPNTIVSRAGLMVSAIRTTFAVFFSSLWIPACVWLTVSREVGGGILFLDVFL